MERVAAPERAGELKTGGIDDRGRPAPLQRYGGLGRRARDLAAEHVLAAVGQRDDIEVAHLSGIRAGDRWIIIERHRVDADQCRIADRVAGEPQVVAIDRGDDAGEGRLLIDALGDRRQRFAGVDGHARRAADAGELKGGRAVGSRARAAAIDQAPLLRPWRPPSRRSFPSRRA